MSLKVAILAAGQGTRMKSTTPKVLNRIAGKALVEWVLDAVGGLSSDATYVVVSDSSGELAAALPDGVDQVVQHEQLGTGHAVQVMLDAADLGSGDSLMVLPADTPLLSAETLVGLAELHDRHHPACTILTTVVSDASGYGRIIRGEDGAVVRIVEQTDASPEELAVNEINAGIYVFDATLLSEALDKVGRDNSQGEYYLTDVLGILNAGGHPVRAVVADSEEVAGINSQAQLAAAGAVMRRRINEDWMSRGVWMADPEQVFVDATVTLEPGVKLYPGTYLEGDTVIEGGASVGPDVFVQNGRIAGDARVWYSVIRDAQVGEGAEVGPYVSLRPGTILRPRSKAGTFVEMKNADIGEGSKVPHLSYMGDVEVGEGANVGAGTITVNYDGFEKHRTVIKDGARIGSDTMLIAPVTIGEGAFTGAGSAISRDVSDGALGIERSQQREIPGYAARREERNRRRLEES